MSKPREFWISNNGGNYVVDFDEPNYVGNKWTVHLIEKSAYEILEAKLSAYEHETETVAELRTKLDKVTLELEFTREYLNPEDTSFRQMCDTFATFTPMQKNKLIDLVSALKNLNEVEND